MPCHWIRPCGLLLGIVPWSRPRIHNMDIGLCQIADHLLPNTNSSMKHSEGRANPSLTDIATGCHLIHRSSPHGNNRNKEDKPQDNGAVSLGLPDRHAQGGRCCKRPRRLQHGENSRRAGQGSVPVARGKGSSVRSKSLVVVATKP